MADHIWTVLCHKPLVDPETDVVTLLEVTESLTSEGLEQQLKEAANQGKKGFLLKVPMQLASWWYRSDPDEQAINARFILINPAGENVTSQEVSFPWAEGSDTLRMYMRMNHVPVSMVGLHWYQVEHRKPGQDDWVAVARIPFHVDSA